MGALYDMMKQELEKQAVLINNNTEKIMLTIDDKIKPLIEENKILKCEIQELNKKISTLEDATRKNNIILHGLKETETNYTQLFKITSQIFKKLEVKMENYDINKIHRIGKKNTDKIRPILISFTTYTKKMQVLKNKNKMPENTYITEDFSKDTMPKRKEPQKELNQEREKGNQVFIRNNKIIVKPKENEKRKREESSSPSPSTSTSQPQQTGEDKNRFAPAKLHRTDPFAYMRNRSNSLTETALLKQ